MMKEERAQNYTGCQPKRKEDKKTRNILKLLDPDAVIKCHRNERTHPHSYTYIHPYICIAVVCYICVEEWRKAQ